MFRDELICFTNSGIIADRTSTVIDTIAKDHAAPEGSPRITPHRWCVRTNSPEIAQ